MQTRIAWGAVALGAMIGLGGALIVFLVLGITGALTEGNETMFLAFLQFLAQLAAGYLAGRLAGRDGVLHGSFAALSLYFIGSALTVASVPDAVSTATLVFFGVVAAIVGSSGGLLADVQRTR